MKTEVEPCPADATSGASGSSSGPGSQPSEPQLSSLVKALQSQTESLDRLGEAILALSIASERAASASLMVLDALSAQSEDDVERDLSGNPVRD